MSEKQEGGKQPWVDPDDAPELTKEFFERAAIYDGEKLIRSGRPRLDAPKQLMSLRLDADVQEGFRALGPGWQTLMNEVLKDYLRRQKRGKSSTATIKLRKSPASRSKVVQESRLFKAAKKAARKAPKRMRDAG